MRTHRRRNPVSRGSRALKYLLLGCFATVTFVLLLLARRAFTNVRTAAPSADNPASLLRQRGIAPDLPAPIRHAAAPSNLALAGPGSTDSNAHSSGPPPAIGLPIRPPAAGHVSDTGSSTQALLRSSTSTPAHFKTIAHLLYDTHPAQTYANISLALYRVVLSTQWFGGPHPAFTGELATCPASGCTLHLSQSPLSIQSWTDADRERHEQAHMLLFHANVWDFVQPGHLQEFELQINPTANISSIDGQPLGKIHRHVALMAGENFGMHEGGVPFELFTTEMTFRPSSFVRESYVLSSLSEYAAQGVPVPASSGRAWDMTARVWEDLWPTPLPWEEKHKTVEATWASHYCTATASGREKLIAELIAAGLSILILGDKDNCLRNAPEDLLQKPREEQSAEMRKYMFHLAFENARLTGYVTEKFYWALLRGQIPVVWGAPDIARHAPGEWSYIDASLYKDKPQELVVLLKTIARNKAMHDRYHAWRRELSFEAYGDILRSELVEMVWLSNATSKEYERYQCRLCHGLRRFESAGGFVHPPEIGVRHMGEDFAPPFSQPMQHIP